MKRCGCIALLLLVAVGCVSTKYQPTIQAIHGTQEVISDKIWLIHEHILVDFIGADQIQPHTWDHDSIMAEVMPYLDELTAHNVDYFVDATPNYLGRDVVLLEKVAQKTGMNIITNTGLYGARRNKFLPRYAMEMTAENLAKMWIDEYENGIDETSIKPGFIKIGVDSFDPLQSIHQKLVKAAVLTHMKTGLSITSHTGKATGLWPQLKLLKEMGVSPSALIWAHANQEEDHENYRKAAEMGCWISLDGLGWEMDKHLEKILFAKEHGILHRILISHDAGWYDPQKDVQSIKPYTNIFEILYPALKARGFTDEEFNLLMRVNPAKAFAIGVRKETSDSRL